MNDKYCVYLYCYRYEIREIYRQTSIVYALEHANRMIQENDACPMGIKTWDDFIIMDRDAINKYIEKKFPIYEDDEE